MTVHRLSPSSINSSIESMILLRKVCYFVLAYVCAFVLAFLIPEQIDRQEYARAVVAYTRSPTQENKAVLVAQRRENDRLHLRDSAVLGVVLVVVGYGIWGGRRFIKRAHRPGKQYSAL